MEGIIASSHYFDGLIAWSSIQCHSFSLLREVVGPLFCLLQVQVRGCCPWHVQSAIPSKAHGYTVILDYTLLYPNDRGETPYFEIQLGPCAGPNIWVMRLPRMCVCCVWTNLRIDVWIMVITQTVGGMHAWYWAWSCMHDIVFVCSQEISQPLQRSSKSWPPFENPIIHIVQLKQTMNRGSPMMDEVLFVFWTWIYFWCFDTDIADQHFPKHTLQTMSMCMCLLSFLHEMHVDWADVWNVFGQMSFLCEMHGD